MLLATPLPSLTLLSAEEGLSIMITLWLVSDLDILAMQNTDSKLEFIK